MSDESTPVPTCNKSRMCAWHEFLDSLASKGGAILILFLLIPFGLLAGWFIKHFSLGVVELVIMSNALTALLTALGISRLNSDNKKPEDPAKEKP